MLISAGKKGDVCIFDVRQRSLRHRFQAHESAIKCLAIDPHEEHFVTGSADGDIRVSIFIISLKKKKYISSPDEHSVVKIHDNLRIVTLFFTLKMKRRY